MKSYRIPPESGFADSNISQATTRSHADVNNDKPLFNCTESMIIDGESRYATHEEFSSDFDTLELIHLTDLQYGHKAFKAARFDEYAKWILSEPNRFVLLGGDLIDAATKDSVGDPHENTSDARTQADGVVKLLTPLQPRILGYVGGNHERRTGRDGSGFESGHQIAWKLKIPYSRGKQFIDIFFGEHAPFKVSLWHGKGASSTKGSKVNMLHRFMMQADSQLYLVGHLHDAFTIFDWRETRGVDDKGEPTIDLVKIAGAMSSSFLDHYGTYAEVAGCAPSDTMMARVILDRSGGWEVTLR